MLSRSIDLVVQGNLALDGPTIDVLADRLGAIRSAVVDGTEVRHRRETLPGRYDIAFGCESRLAKSDAWMGIGGGPRLSQPSLISEWVSVRARRTSPAAVAGGQTRLEVARTHDR